MFGVAIIAVFWIGLTYLLSIEHAKTLDTAIQHGNSAARLFEETTTRLLKDTDRKLLFLRLAYEEDPKHFDLRKWAERISLIGDLTIQAALIGPDGYMISSTAAPAGASLYLGDREHFRVHVDGKADELHIGKPVMGRASGKLSIQLSRRLRQPDGSFGGVIVASIDPGFAEQFYRSINLGSRGGINLRGLDGAIRASYGFTTPNFDKDNAPKVLSQAIARSPSGYFWGGGAIDGINRLAFYRVATEYPLIVTLGVTEQDIFADYERHRVMYLALATVLTLLVLIAFTFGIHRQSSLKIINTRFRAALENMPHGLCMFDADKRLIVWNDNYANLYRFPPEFLKVGTPHDEMVAFRVEHGLFTREESADPLSKKLDELARIPFDQMASRIEELPDGRLIRVTRQPI